MNLEKYFIELRENYPDINLPTVINIEDYNESQLLIDGEWTNAPYSCGIVQKNEKLVYVETDNERGYVFVDKEFEDEIVLEKYLISRFTISANASKEKNTLEEMAIRYVQQKYNYSEKQSRKMILQMAKHKDIFEEFFNYIRVNKLCKNDGTQVSIGGYTAEKLMNEYQLSGLGAYNFLVYLLEEPKEALADLKAGLPRK